MSEPTYRIDRPSVFMHVTPDIAGEVSDELPYGTGVRKLSGPFDAAGHGSYYRCETEYGYCGYLHEKYLNSPDEADGEEPLYPFVVTAPYCDVLIDSLYKYRPIVTLPRGARVYARRERLGADRFFPILHKKRRCFVPSAALRPYKECRTAVSGDEGETLRRRVCDDALSYLGTPYRWGGRTPSGIDCSGLCFTAFFLNGLVLWRDAFADKRYVHEIGETQLLPADLIYFKGHMAMYIGGGEYVHASASAGCVTVNSLHKESLIYRDDLAQKVVCFARSNRL